MVLYNSFSNIYDYRNLSHNENQVNENICIECDNNIINENDNDNDNDNDNENENENDYDNDNENDNIVISIKKALECIICLNIATLPVHPVCCIESKSMSPACLKCVREYLQLNKPIRLRSTIIKSWTGCGCDINTTLYGASSYYKHTFELDSIRNIVGTSKCFNEGCNAEFSTCSELRKHLIGPTDDKLYGICQEALIKCSLCNYFDKRKIILGKHYINNHLTINCNVCNLLIPYTIINDHYKLHKNQLKKLKNYIENIKLE